MKRQLPVGLRFDSLSFRVVASSTIWAVLTLVIVATIISTFYRQASERGFDSVLSAHLFSLIGSVGVGEDGSLQGSPNLGDFRFSEPGTGWYWSVEPAGGDIRGMLSSPSMSEPIPSPSTEDVPFDGDFQRRYLTDGPAGEIIDVIESEFLLDGQGGIARFRVMGNYSELEQEIDAFGRQLYLYLAVFGLGMIVINALAILIGLRPLARVRKALADIRAGSAQQLDGRFPAEIAPLASEANALIESNRRIVERARTQVGNLAHSLKTPLAVMMNEGRAMEGPKGRLIAEQAMLMQQQIEHYLQRARSAAQRDVVVYRTPTRETLARMLRVMAKLNPAIDLDQDLPDRELVFAGEKEDFEELCGNLLENAYKWARGQVRVSLAPLARREGGPAMLELTIEDDGPGIPEDQANLALKRGQRLDETKPGTGLGLAIVSELVAEYGGELLLDSAQIGGLRVRVRLKQVQD
ncbi:histidine kinase [Chelativorans sp. ZYF759]|uniref:ATP-binding protein n=1 Tax=Chelativorans sp. ZYF759 TaxID=2692213 RepID=UPI00145EBB9B|nr:ATP-binding protein [Chelativorans sp. ZYF759]NMG38987.1 histidine kinase [Chelativorans sp. ZYF759]